MIVYSLKMTIQLHSLFLIDIVLLFASCSSVSLYLEKNLFEGSLEPICDVLDERRDDFDLYLRLINADCSGDSPQVECSCCQCFR